MLHSTRNTRNQEIDYEINGTKLETVQCVEDFRVTVAFILKFSQHCKGDAGKANRMLGFINRNFWFKNTDLIIPLYTSLVRPHLEYAVQFWAPDIGYSETTGCPAKDCEDDYVVA